MLCAVALIHCFAKTDAGIAKPNSTFAKTDAGITKSNSTFAKTNQPVGNADAKTSVALPLQAVEADSMQWMDFFWYYYKEKGKGYSLRHTWDWSIKGKASPKRMAEADKISLTGTEGDIRRALHLFRENYTLAMLTANAHYFDNAERILYNDILRYWTMVESGQPVDDDTSTKTKKQVFDLLRSAGTMAYALSGEHIYINLLARGLTHVKNRQVEAYIQSMNSSPWYYETSLTFQSDGTLISVDDSKQVDDYTRIFYHDTTSATSAHRAPDSVRATLHIRIPSWVSGKGMIDGYQSGAGRANIQIFVNGQLAYYHIQDGYAVVSRVWHVRDLVAVKIPTPILRVRKENEGKPAQDGGRQTGNVGGRTQVALQRGPMVYCVEKDDGGPIAFDAKAAVSHRFSKEDSCMVLSVPVEIGGKRDTLLALPYYKNLKSGTIFMNAK